MNKRLLVSIEKFEDRSCKTITPMIETYNTTEEFECGCGNNHKIDEIDTIIIKQTDLFEFVVQCSNNYRTLVESDMYGKGHYSIMSYKLDDL